MAFEGRPAAAFLGALLQTPLFSAEALARFRLLFVPAAWAGGPVTTHPFEILALLMGHAGPEMTVNVYVQTLDWLQRLYVDREVVQGREPRLTLPQAARAVRKSLPTLYAWFPDGKRSQGIPCSQVLERQRGVLNEAASLGRRPAVSRRTT